MPAARPVCLVDASPYIFRAHFSLPASIRRPEGTRTGAVYGFASFLLKLIAAERPAHLAVAFDRNLTGSFRNDFYPAYKAQRDQPPAELVAQLASCEEVAAALGAATFIDDRYEADDLIATLAAGLGRRGHPALVVTSDKDLAQLVSERVTLYDFAKQTRYTPELVHERFGVRPDQITDLLGLAGDAVDNIPGVPGIGRKTAAGLLAVFGHLEALYERLDEVRGPGWRGGQKLWGRLATHRDSAFLSRRLATLVDDVPAARGTGLPQLAYRGPDGDALDSLFDRLGFKGIRERVADR